MIDHDPPLLGLAAPISSPIPAPIPAPGRTDRWTRAFLRVLGGLEAGRVTVVTPQGGRVTFSGRRPGPSAALCLHEASAVRRLFLGGAVGFAEAYVDGGWSSPDLAALLELAALNEARTDVAGSRLVLALRRLWHLARANTRRGSRRNVSFHYDLGNDFYRLWLDRGMQYSCALYEGGEDLEAAQEAKLARVSALLDPRPGDAVLEIGCGWGALAERLVVEHGAAVTGLTLSREQLDWARRRLGGRADLRLQDYRDVGGAYDRIASIEMVEAVGERNWPTYFQVLHDRLKPGGVAVIQAITIAEERFAAYRRGADFIQRHVFPGGMLPTAGLVRGHARRAGLRVAAQERFGLSYARTLAEWNRRFQAAWPRIEAQGFDARFKRLWEYYLAYCEAGFRTGAVDVGLYRFERPS
ncbi:cyclopropane-fatty-acyl-phospholipid synthase family protein [Arenibaculum sp.]|uniref:cyclopropane-fatty-acyl-phospholipid synthase family protein n=1 Tax=Arenibaculum sp. TaxID=2865862 RepID=UPI002E14C683|nr:cyclopropane-fatty-acyl-phospholipid synthase family protein [Arenibaculum sp.]